MENTILYGRHFIFSKKYRWLQQFCYSIKWLIPPSLAYAVFFLCLCFSAGQSNNKSALIASDDESCLRHCWCRAIATLCIMAIIYYISKQLYGIDHPYIIGEVADSHRLDMESKCYIISMFHHLFHPQIPGFYFVFNLPRPNNN